MLLTRSIGVDHAYYCYLGTLTRVVQKRLFLLGWSITIHDGLGHRNSNLCKNRMLTGLSSTRTHEVQDGHRAERSAKQENAEDTSSTSEFEGLEHLWEVEWTQLQES